MITYNNPLPPKGKEYLTLFRPEYVDLLGGDHLAALMLAQIIYWYLPTPQGKTKLRKFRDGYWWMAKSHVDWYEELRLTRRQSQRCIEVLRNKGLIDTALYLFDGHPTVHVRCVLIMGNVLPIEHLGTFHCALQSIPLNAGVQSITETTTKTTTKKKEANEFAEENLNSKNKEQVGKDNNKSNNQNNDKSNPTSLGKNMATAAEILEQRKLGKTTIATSLTPSGLGMRWKKLLGSDGTYIKELTTKQLGQLKHFLKAIGPDSLPAMDFAVTNWNSFVWETKSAKGLKVVPEKPDIGFLQQHHDVLMQLIAKQNKTPEVIEIIFDKPTVVCNTEKVEEKASSSDILATLAALEALNND